MIMDGFTYNDIFQTKGIEYLVVIAFLLLLIPFWLMINRRSKAGARLEAALGILTLGRLKVPEGVYFGRNHTWAYLEKTGLAQVGVDDMLLHITGEVSFSPLVSPGERLNKGDAMAEVVQGEKSLKVYAPVSGEVVSFNDRMSSGVISDDPYRDGWLFRIEPLNWKAETAGFYLGREARLWFSAELERFKDFLARSMVRHAPGDAMLVLQEGGEITDRPLEALGRSVWDDFQEEFLE